MSDLVPNANTVSLIPRYRWFHYLKPSVSRIETDGAKSRNLFGTVYWLPDALFWRVESIFYISHSDTKIMLFPLKLFIAYPSRQAGSFLLGNARRMTSRLKPVCTTPRISR